MRIFIKAIVILLLSVSVFAQETPSSQASDDKLSQLKTCLTEKNYEKAQEIVRNSQGQADFGQLNDEMYAESKKLILSEDYENAEKLLKIVLSIDSENIEAQDTYVNLVKIKKDKQKREEQERIKKEAEEQKQMEEKANFEKENKITNIGLQNFSCDFRISPAVLTFYQSQFYNYYYDKEITHWLYGLSGFGSVYFNHPFITAGIEAKAIQNLASFDSAGGKPFYANFCSQITSPALIPFPLYLRGGISILSYSQFSETTNVFYTSVLSPAIGLGIRKLSFLDQQVEVQFHSDVLLASLMGKNMDFALTFGVSALYRYLTIGAFSLYAGIDYDHLVFFGYSKSEHLGAIQITAGVTIQ